MRRTIVPGVCVLALAVLGAQRPPGPSAVDSPARGVTVPMRSVGGRPAINVMLNGKGPVSLVLDTGAAGGAVDPDAVASLGLGVENGIVPIAALGIGDVTLLDVVLRTSTFARGLGPDAPQGVMSASWFAGHLVIFDFPRKTITIVPGALPAADNQTILASNPTEVLPGVPITVAGRAHYVHLDTGSPGGLMLPLHMSTELPLSGPLVAAGSASTPAGGTFEIKAAPVNGDVKLGQFTLDVGPVRFSDLRPGPGPAPGNLGSDALKSFVVTYDSTNHRFRFERRTSEAFAW
jgi:hypothetical protein